MRFYTLKAVTTNGNETRDLRGFDTLDEALIRFHSDLTSNIGKCDSILEMLINSEGGIHKNETWKKEVVPATVDEKTE